MTYLSNQSTRVSQAIFIFIIIIFFILWVINFMLSPSWNNLLIGLVLIFFGVIIFFHLKLREVYLSKDKIIIHSLFSKKEIIKDRIDRIENTFLSPIVYRLSIKMGKKIYFIVDEKMLLKESLKFGSNLLLKRLNEEVMK